MEEEEKREVICNCDSEVKVLKVKLKMEMCCRKEESSN